MDVMPPSSSDAAPGSGAWARTRRLAWWALAPALALVFYRGVYQFEFLGDAQFLILENRFLREPGMAWQQVVHNYFWSSSGNIIPYWRPWTKLSWYWEYQLFGPSPAGFMAVQLAWHLLGILGVQLLARALGATRAVAALAGLWFALHPVAVAPVCMLMARSDVVAACAMVWLAVGWVRWCGGGGAPWLALAALALALGLGSKETVVVAPAILAGWVLVRQDARASLRRWAPALAGSALMAGGYLLCRRAVLESDAAGLQAVAVELEPARLWASLAMYCRSLWPFIFTSGVRDVPLSEASSVPFAVRGLVALGAAAAVGVWAARRREWEWLWLMGWAGVALGPVVVAAGIHVPGADGKYPLADRWLYHALGPAMLLCALALGELMRRIESRLRVARAVAALLVAGCCGLWLAGSGDATREFASVDGMLDNEDRAYYHATPASHRTEQDECRFLDRKVVRALRAGDHAAVLDRSARLTARCGETPERGHPVLSSLVTLGRFKEAEPLARRLMRAPPTDRRGHAAIARLAGQVFLRVGAPADAEAALRAAAKLGGASCRTLLALAEAQRAQAKLAPAGRQLVEAYRCGGRTDPSILLMAATLLLQAGEREPTARLLRAAENHRLSDDQQAQARRLRDGLR